MIFSILWFYSHIVWIKHFSLLKDSNKKSLHLWFFILRENCFQQCKFYLKWFIKIYQQIIDKNLQFNGCWKAEIYSLQYLFTNRKNC